MRRYGGSDESPEGGEALLVADAGEEEVSGAVSRIEISTGYFNDFWLRKCMFLKCYSILRRAASMALTNSCGTSSVGTILSCFSNIRPVSSIVRTYALNADSHIGQIRM